MTLIFTENILPLVRIIMYLDDVLCAVANYSLALKASLLVRNTLDSVGL